MAPVGGSKLPLTARRLDWPDCRNARDLGGLPVPGGVTRTRMLVRSDNIANLTAAGHEAMIAYGVSTVIDLRSPSEVMGSRSPFITRGGLTHVHVPLVDDSMLLKLGEASGMFERYLLMLEHRQQAFSGIFNTVAAAEGGVLFHCFAGKDRTGLVAAMMLSLAGVEVEAIAGDYAETDTQLAARYQEWLAAAPPDRREEMRRELHCPPERVLAILDHLRQRWGGVETYLEMAGVSAGNLSRLGTRLT